MAEFIKETVITTSSNANTTATTPSTRQATSSQTIEYLIYFFFGVLDIALVFRLVLKLMGANGGSAFVSAIYGFTGLFIMPFEGIFRRWSGQGIETTAVLEPATLVAIFVYAALAWGIVKLIKVLSGERQTE